IKSDNMGKKFIVSFPMNDNEDQPESYQSILIASNADGIVKYHQAGSSNIKTVEVGKDAYTKLGSDNETLPNDIEFKGTDEKSNKTIILESTVPISVFVINSKAVTSEGYYSVPIKNWGMEYRHLSFYDFNEVKEWAGGFHVIAAEDDTKVDITINGVGTDQKTVNGIPLGDSFSIKLDAGEVFDTRGTGETRGIYDISGSLIESDKPIGVISYHERAMIPATRVTNGRDHLSEMLMPTESWGKNFYSMPTERGGTNKGDFFRIMSVENNTEFKVRWYNPETKEIIGVWEGFLNKAGDFEEYHPNAASACNSENPYTSINGFAVWESSKPVQVMQYAYSSCWDNAPNADPFMMLLSPVEQYSQDLLIATPIEIVNDTFEDNYLTLIVKLNEGENVANALNDIYLDGERLTNNYPDLADNVIDNAIYHTQKITPGFHEISSESPISGVVHGLSTLNSYAWNLGNNIKDLTVQDTLKPQIQLKDDGLGKFKVTFSEKQNLPKDQNCEDCKPQEDSGIFREPTVIEINNFYYYLDNEIESDDWAYGTKGDDELNYIFEVENTDFNAKIIFQVIDDRCNIAIDSIVYTGTKSVDNMVSIEGNLVELFPNPASDKLSINSSNKILVDNLKINNLTGTLMLQLNEVSLPNRININDYEIGVYFITFNYKGNNYKLRFIKQ
ncbi:T9SS type A sorting domain-containing protein, partial [Candidatus Kapabacteria bacterium]|nr:T9SS type A sorting domain-containing protein [Candidatus Kapabacteria bacterium]